MYNIFWKRSGSIPLPVLTLDGVWRVDGDKTYHIRPSKDWSAASYIAIRTEKGRGILLDHGSRQYILQEDSLLFLQARDIAEYWTADTAWKFFWFEFSCQDDSLFSAGHTYTIPFSASEKEQIRECYLNLSSTQKKACFLSQADFLHLLFSWLVLAPSPVSFSRKDLITILESGGRRNLSVPEIAKEAGMCQRSFRTEVHKLTGFSPTEYLTKMKMDTAMEMLCSTDKTLQEISDSLHYGNPFYFSRVFKQYYGISPGKARRKASDESKISSHP